MKYKNPEHGNEKDVFYSSYLYPENVFSSGRYQTSFHTTSSSFRKRSSPAGVLLRGVDTIVKLNNDFNAEARERNGTMPYIVFKIGVNLDADIKRFNVDRFVVMINVFLRL